MKRLSFFDRRCAARRKYFQISALILALLTVNLPAQTLNVLHTFGATAGGPHSGGANSDGANPNDGLLLSGTTLYGVAPQGGANSSGVVFSLSITGTNFTIVHTFGPAGYRNAAAGDYAVTNLDGIYPSGVLAVSGNTLFGYCAAGGLNGYGSVFSVTIGGTNFTVLHTFSLLVTNALHGSPTVNADGAGPTGLILSGNTLYGTAKIGGTNGSGTIFELATNGGLTTLHSFTSAYLVNGSDGGNPDGGLWCSNNILYGTTEDGGANGSGVVYAMTNNGGWFSTLYAFPAASYLDNYFNSTGTEPLSRVILSGNTLYGSAYLGGTNGDGTLFSLVNLTNIALLHTFSAYAANSQYSYTNADGAEPVDNFLLSGGTLYGTTSFAGLNGEGTIFSMDTNGGNFTTLYTFSPPVASTNADGSSPNGNLIMASNALYGTTLYGGTNGNGTIFMVTTRSTPMPLAITGVSIAGNNLVIHAVNGVSGATCTVLMSTNPMLARFQWTPVATNILNASGNFSITVTNTATPSVKSRFYSLEM
jgi:uncharacterized repeat protein (TIGR03803 family)